MQSFFTVTHAEYKAIVGGPKVEGCTLYVTTYPCNMCARVIVQAGITKVVYYYEGSGKPTYQSSKKMLTTCLEEKMTQDKIRSFVLIDNERKKEKKREEKKQKAEIKREEKKQEVQTKKEESKHRSILLLK